MPSPAAQLLGIAVSLGVTGYLLNQMRKPSRWVGRVFLKNMNARHSAVTDWGLSQVPLGDQLSILDVGCGGGRTLEKLAAAAPRAHLVGVDYADGSVAESRAHNAALIAERRMEVLQASVDRLPGPSSQFDLVTAVETHYYWPDMVGGLREIRRVLRPGGTIVLVAETYREGVLGVVAQIAMAPLRASVLTAKEHEARLVDAGFKDIEVFTDPRRGWICVVGRAPL